MAYKQQKFVFHSARRWEVQGQCASRCSIWWEPASWFTDGWILSISSHGRRGRRALFYKGTNPIHESSTLMSISPPKGPTSKYYHTGDSVSTFEFGGEANIQFMSTSNQSEWKVLIKHLRYLIEIPKRSHLKSRARTSLVVQWLRIRLPMQGTWVRSLVEEDPTCCGTTKPVRHNYWAWALEPASHNYWAQTP